MGRQTNESSPKLASAFVVAATVLSTVTTPASAAAADSLKNRVFDQGQAFWSFFSFAPGFSHGSIVWLLGFGKVAQIVNSEVNDSRWRQRLPVKPHRKYLAMALIKTDNVVTDPHGLGNACASIGVEAIDFSHTTLDQFQHSTPLCGTHDWTGASVVICTADETELYVVDRLGWFAEEAAGTAWFDQNHWIPLGLPC
jgi:hypothetical protein